MTTVSLFIRKPKRFTILAQFIHLSQVINCIYINLTYHVSSYSMSLSIQSSPELSFFSGLQTSSLSLYNSISYSAELQLLLIFFIKLKLLYNAQMSNLLSLLLFYKTQTSFLTHKCQIYCQRLLLLHQSVASTSVFVAGEFYKQR